MTDNINTIYSLYLLLDENYENNKAEIQNISQNYIVDEKNKPLYVEVFSFKDKEYGCLLFNNLNIARYFKCIHIEYIQLLKDIIYYYRYESNIMLYFLSAIEIYGAKPQTDECLEIINYIEYLDLEENSSFTVSGISDIENYLSNLLVKKSNSVDKPSYIIEQEQEIDMDKLLKLDYEDFAHVSNDELIKKIMKMMTVSNEDYDNVFNRISKTIDNLSSHEKNNLIKHYTINVDLLESIIKDKTLFRLYGPVNPELSPDWTTLKDENGEPDYNKIYGGPRMFIDTSFETDSNNWFTGKCSYCDIENKNFKKIKKMKYAVRRPYWAGGWIGCYCSWRCVRSSILSEYPDDIDFDCQETVQYLEEIHGKQKITSLRVELTLINLYEDLLNEYGIYEQYNDEEFGEEFDVEEDDYEYEYNDDEYIQEED